MKLTGLTNYFLVVCAFLLLIIVSACRSPTQTLTPSHSPSYKATTTQQPPTPSPIKTTSPTPSRTPSPTKPSPTASPQICSPLEGILLSELTNQIVNPFNPPRAGSDDPHQGVDFAVLDQTNTYAIEGPPVHAVLSGYVAGLIADRFPYGFAIMVETPLDDSKLYNPDWIQIPTLAPTRGPHPILTCPETDNTPAWETDHRSLYLLYAHLQDIMDWHLGDAVACGETLGAIGSTGNALNPHFHLEVRVGPSGATFTSMAHYDASASPDEMANYCTWRVSDLFQLLDPMQLIMVTP